MNVTDSKNESAGKKAGIVIGLTLTLVHLLGINTVYKLGNGVITNGNGDIVAEMNGDDFIVKILYDDEYYTRINEHLKDAFVYDEVKINPIDSTDPAGIPYSEKYDFSEAITKFSDRVPLKDRIRIITNQGNIIKFTDDEMHLILNDASTHVYVRNGTELVINTINGDEFTTVNKNEMLMHSDESIEDVFAAQIIDEINLLSGDYIDYGDEEDEDYEE